MNTWVKCQLEGEPYTVWTSQYGFAWFMVFNATFNNISVISWGSVLLVEETGVTGENHRPVESRWQTSSQYE